MNHIPPDLRIELVRGFYLFPRNQYERQAFVDEILQIKRKLDSEIDAADCHVEPDDLYDDIGIEADDSNYIVIGYGDENSEAQSLMNIYDDGYNGFMTEAEILATIPDVDEYFDIGKKNRCPEVESAKCDYDYVCDLECMLYRAKSFESCFDSSEHTRLKRVYQDRNIDNVPKRYYQNLASNLIRVAIYGQEEIDRDTVELHKFELWCEEEAANRTDDDFDYDYEDYNKVLDEIDSLTESIDRKLAALPYIWEVFSDLISHKEMHQHFPDQVVDIVLNNRRHELVKVLGELTI